MMKLLYIFQEEKNIQLVKVCYNCKMRHNCEDRSTYIRRRLDTFSKLVFLQSACSCSSNTACVYKAKSEKTIIPLLLHPVQDYR